MTRWPRGSSWPSGWRRSTAWWWWASVDPVAVGLGDADAVTDAVGTASVVGSAKALVAGAPTSAAATSRVPARRSRAPRGVVGVDIGAFLSGSRRDARTTGSPGHSGSVPHSSTVLWSRSHLPGIPTCRDVTSRPTAAGQCRTWTGFPRTGACGCRPKATARLYSHRGGARVARSVTGGRQNGGGSWSWGRGWCRVRRQGQCSGVVDGVGLGGRCGVGEVAVGGGVEEGDAVDGEDFEAVSAVLVAPGGHWPGWWPGGGAVWCSRWNSRLLWGPSGRRVRARLLLVGAVGGAGDVG